jgi:ubiquinone/menaquinone biosynthesis C-methylase UbiE
MVMNYNLQTYKKNGWPVDQKFYDSLTEYEKSFVELELGTYKALDFYKSRLKVIGFSECKRVLDAGCGIGQWSIALGELNDNVDGIDLMPSRINFAQSLSRSMEKNNVNFRTGSLENLPYEDASFDVIFCYGVFMFTHIEKTLGEFYRVLKPGGKIYLNFNSLGWYAHLIIDRGLKQGNFSVVWQALKMCMRYFCGGKQQILIRQHWLEKKVKNIGFKHTVFATEGHLTPHLQPNQIKPKSIYQSHYYGMRSIIEMMAEK